MAERLALTIRKFDAWRSARAADGVDAAARSPASSEPSSMIALPCRRRRASARTGRTCRSYVGVSASRCSERSSKTVWPLVAPRRLLQPGEQLGAARLVAAALAEDLAGERVDGVDVDAGERRAA